MRVWRETANVIAHNFAISNYLIIYYHYVAALHFRFSWKNKMAVSCVEILRLRDARKRENADTKKKETPNGKMARREIRPLHNGDV